MSSSNRGLDDGESNLNEDAEYSDEEVLLKGSDLEKLASSMRDDVEVYTPDKWMQGTIPPIHAKPPSEGPCAEFLALKELILTSNLLLEEDMSLVLDSCSILAVTGTNPETLFEKMSGVLLGGSIFAVACSCYHVVTAYKWPALLMLFSSFGTTLFLTYKIFRMASLRKAMTSVLSELTELCQFIRHTTISLKESYVVVNSKLILSTHREANRIVVSRYYAQVEADIVSNMQAHMKFLIAIIEITRNATRAILASWRPHYSCKVFFAALCADEDFNIPNPDDIVFDVTSINKLESLSSAFAVIQSEYLRALGTAFCLMKISERQKIETMLSAHLKLIREHLAAAKQEFSGRLYSQYYANKAPALFDEARDLTVLRLDSSLSSLLYEVVGIKSYLRDKSGISLDDRPYLDLAFRSMKKAMAECSDVFNVMYTLLQKDRDDAALSLAGDVVQEPAVRTGIEIGPTEPTLTEEDRVYLGITVRDDSSEEDSCFEPEEPTPIYPRSLMHELKGVLERKRVEFRKRESDAVTKSAQNDVDKQFDLVMLNKCLTDPEQMDGPSTSSTTPSTKRRQRHERNDPQPSGAYVLNFNLTSIAASAAKTSMLWNLPDEEFFGEDIDEYETCDECESCDSDTCDEREYVTCNECESSDEC